MMLRAGIDLVAVLVVVMVLAVQAVQAQAGSAASAPAAVVLDGLASQDPPPHLVAPALPPVHALRTVNAPPVVDGKLDDAAWTDTPELAPLAPIEGPWGPGRTTSARLVRCGDDLYVSVRCGFEKATGASWYKKAFPAPPHDSVKHENEIVVLNLSADGGSDSMVEMIIHPSAAYTDRHGRDLNWTGDIAVATTMDDNGWCVEARVGLPSLPGWASQGRQDVLGANVSRRTRSRTGGWAQTRRVTLGWLTSAEGLAVEELAVGLFSPPQQRGDQVPVQVRLRNLDAQQRRCAVTIDLLDDADQPLRHETIRLTLPANQAAQAMRQIDGSGASSARIRIDAGAGQPAFEARLPLEAVPDRTDCTSSAVLAAAVRPTLPMWLSDEVPSAYVMAVSMGDQPVARQGRLTLRDAAGEPVWQCPVDVNLPPGGRDARLIAITPPAPGRYRLEWRLADRGSEDQAPAVDIDYAPISYLTELTALGPAQLLARLQCAPSNEAQDLALLGIKLERLGEALARQRSDAKTDRTEEIQKLYWQMLELVDAMRTGRPFIATQRGWFESVFRSPADGSYQPVAMFVPADYDEHPDRRYPLEVWLHGSGTIHLARTPMGNQNASRPGYEHEITDRIVVFPMGRGRSCGYGGVAGNDVREAIKAVQARYRIDPDRVHLGGESMGGFGSFEVASQSPDLFASCTPTMGGGYWCDLEQMHNLPTFIHHGMADNMVSTFCSISTAAKMEALGCRVQLFLYPRLIHEPLPIETTTPMRNLLGLVRDNQPASVVLKGRMLCFTHAYWAAIGRFSDPQKPGKVEATFVGPNQLSIAASNVKWLRIALPCKWIDPAKPLYITRGDGRGWTILDVGTAKGLYLRLDGERIEAVTQRPAEVDDATAYTGGGVRRMFCEGRPVRLVYGTGGGADALAAAKALAQGLARNSFARGEFEVGGWPVLADVEVTDDVMASCDLILLGTPADNAVLARMADQLPVSLADGNVSVQADPPMQYRQDEVMFTLHWRNPLAKDRLIWWLGGFDSKESIQRVAYLDEQDLVVATRKDFAVQARAQVAGDWQLVQPAPLTKVRAIWPTFQVFSQQITESLRAHFDADVAIDSNWDEPDGFTGQTLGRLCAGAPDMHLVYLGGAELREMYQGRQRRFADAASLAAARSQAASQPAAAGAAARSQAASQPAAAGAAAQPTSTAALQSASAPASQPTSAPASQPAGPTPEQIIEGTGGWAGVEGDQIRDEQTYRVLLINGAIWGLPNSGANAQPVRYLSDQEVEAAQKRFYNHAAPAAAQAP